MWFNNIDIQTDHRQRCRPSYTTKAILQPTGLIATLGDRISIVLGTMLRKFIHRADDMPQ